MAVLPMRRISIYGLKSQRKGVLELLQRRGAVEVIQEPMKEEALSTMDTQAARNQFAATQATAKRALEILDIHCPVKKSPLVMLEGRRPISLEAYNSSLQRVTEIGSTASRIVQLEREREDCKAEILRLQTQLESLTPWLGLDISMRMKGTRSTSVFIGTFPQAYTREQILEALAQKLPEVRGIEVEVLSTLSQQTCVFLVCLSEESAAVETALRSMGFAWPQNPSKKPPSQRAEQLKGWIQEQEKKQDGILQELKTYGDRRDDLCFLYDYYAMRIEKYEVLALLRQSRRTFIITGYLPAKNVPALEKELTETFTVFVETEEPGEDEEVPVALENNGFAAPMEPVLEGYSLPKRGEVDPCTPMACFYYLLFGMMLSDAAYGLIMTIGCAIALLKFKNMESGLKKSLKMFMYSGISTTFWGILFGSWFGDAVTVISKTFFGTEVTIPALWFVPLNEPMRLLVFSFLLGIIHLFAGLGVQFYQCAKAGRWKDAIYDVVFWYLLVGGGIVYLLTMEMTTEMLGLGFTLPEPVGTISAICAGIGAVGVLFTAGRESKNPGKRLLKGIYGLYNVSGYLSDILSYSRLLALGLATGVIASVFNQMGAMVGGGVVGAIVFTLVFLIGHTLNIGINVLGAYVHTNRLQYVEFFGKFYEGGGKKFNPFAAHTKYYKIREENKP